MRVLISEKTVHKTFGVPGEFEDEVEAMRRLHAFGNNHHLSGGWVARVPALLTVDVDSATVAMERAGGDTIASLANAGKSVPWYYVGEALGNYHRTASLAGAKLHNDLSIVNIIIDIEGKAVWLIDPWMIGDQREPAHDLLVLLWAICRLTWKSAGWAAGGDFVAGWRRGADRHLPWRELAEGWPGTQKRLNGRHVRKNIPAVVRKPSYFVFLYAWLPLVLWTARRRKGDPTAVKTAGVANTST